MIGDKYRKYCNELSNELRNANIDNEIHLLSDENFSIHAVNQYLSNDILFLQWRISSLYLALVRRHCKLYNTKLILCSGVDNERGTNISLSNIFDSFLPLTNLEFSLPAIPNDLLNILKKTSISASISSKGIIDFLSYISPNFSTNSLETHHQLRKYGNWTNPKYPIKKKLIACKQIVYNWGFQNIKENRLMYVRPIWGTPNDNHNRPISSCFVLMPFHEPFKTIYKDHIYFTMDGMGITCNKADDFYNVHNIMTDIWNAILMNSFVIADITGKNPNVLYEVGIAHAIGKPVILMTQNMDDVPFDLRSMRVIKYEYTPRGCKDLENVLKDTAINTINEVGEIEKDIGSNKDEFRDFINDAF